MEHANTELKKMLAQSGTGISIGNNGIKIYFADLAKQWDSGARTVFQFANELLAEVAD